MPFGSRPCCISCETKNAAVWRKDSDGKPICHSCFNKPIEKEDSSENHNNGNGQLWKPPGRDRSAVGSQYVGPIRKSARIKPAKHKYQAIVKPLATKGKSRRIVFKKNVCEKGLIFCHFELRVDSTLNSTVMTVELTYKFKLSLNFDIRLYAELQKLDHLTCIKLKI